MVRSFNAAMMAGGNAVPAHHFVGGSDGLPPRSASWQRLA